MTTLNFGVIISQRSHIIFDMDASLNKKTVNAYIYISTILRNTCIAYKMDFNIKMLIKMLMLVVHRVQFLGF